VEKNCDQIRGFFGGKQKKRKGFWWQEQKVGYEERVFALMIWRGGAHVGGGINKLAHCS